MKFAGLAIAALCAGQAQAATSFAVNLPYLSEADIPVGFYAGGLPLFLENFEDGILDGGISVNAGMQILAPGGITDSVDGDDGLIDGFGNGGRSIFGGTMRFTFAAPVTAAALVWTDGSGFATFRVFDAFGDLIDSTPPIPVGDNTFGGTTRDDRFFGVLSLGGISAIEIGTGGLIEVDHVQYGNAFVVEPPVDAVPLPAGLPLLLAGLGTFAALRRRSA